MLWLLRLFRTFTDMEALAQTQARQAEARDGRLRELDNLAQKRQIDCALFEAERNNLRHDLDACREALEELSTEKLLLQDRLDSAIADKDNLWAAMTEALNNERDAYRMTVNHAVQKSGGGIPFPDSHSLPPNLIREPQKPGPVGRRGRLLPSEVASRQTRRYVEALHVANIDADESVSA